ncbi:MAG: transposase [Terriglobales bacterium]
MQQGEAVRLWGFVDWATQKHSACVVDGQGKAVAEFEVDNSPEGLSELVVKLTGLCDGNLETMRIGIERPDCPVVDVLLDAGFTVFTLNPKQMDRFRDRYSPAGAKDDRRDCFVGGNALRTDANAFHRVEPESDAARELREWSRIDREVCQDSVGLANRLREQVLRVAPHWLELCPAADAPWFWTLLELAPTPKAGAGLTLRQVRVVLRRHRIQRLRAEQVLTAWQTSCLGTPQGVLTAVSAHIGVLLSQLRPLHEERRKAKAALDRCMKAYKAEAQAASPAGRCDDITIVLSQPGIGLGVAASLFGEAGRCLRERNLRAFRTQTGIAPITKQSGKSRQVLMRRACQVRLRDACFHWARCAVIYDPHSKEHYAALKRKGHSHARALRGVADRLAGRLFVMLERGTLYDPNHRRVPSGEKTA